MPPGHDADIVVTPDGHIASNILQIAADDLLRPGEQLLPCKLLPVIHDHAAKAHMGEDRDQLLGNMPAAEDVDLAGTVYLFGKNKVMEKYVAGTAADGAADAPLPADQHPGTGTPGRGTGGGYDGNQYQSLPLFQFCFMVFSIFRMDRSSLTPCVPKLHRTPSP